MLCACMCSHYTCTPCRLYPSPRCQSSSVIAIIIIIVRMSLGQCSDSAATRPLQATWLVQVPTRPACRLTCIVLAEQWFLRTENPHRPGEHQGMILLRVLERAMPPWPKPWDTPRPADQQCTCPAAGPETPSGWGVLDVVSSSGVSHSVGSQDRFRFAPWSANHVTLVTSSAVVQ